MTPTAVLIVWLVTGVKAHASMEATRCHQIAADVTAGRRILADVEGEPEEILIARAECREVQQQTPVS